MKGLMRQRKSVCLACLSIGILLLLMGCAEGTFYVKVNEDASAELDYQLGFDRSLLGVFAFSAEDFIAQLNETAQIEGYDVSLYSNGNMTGVRMQKHIRTLEEVDLDFGIFDFGTAINSDTATTAAIESPILQIEDTIWHTEYKVYGNVDLSSIAISDRYSVPIFENSLLNQIDLRFVLDLPIVPERHNATHVSGDGHKLEWVLVLGKNNSIEMEGRIPNVKNRIYFLVVVSLSCLIGYGYYKYSYLHNHS